MYIRRFIGIAAVIALCFAGGSGATVATVRADEAPESDVAIVPAQADPLGDINTDTSTNTDTNTDTAQGGQADGGNATATGGTSTNVNTNTVSPVINVISAPAINIQLPPTVLTPALPSASVVPSTPVPSTSTSSPPPQPTSGTAPGADLSATADQVPMTLSANAGVPMGIVGKPFTLSGGRYKFAWSAQVGRSGPDCSLRASLSYAYNGKPEDRRDQIKEVVAYVTRTVSKTAVTASTGSYESPQGAASGEVWIDSLPPMTYVLRNSGDSWAANNCTWQITVSR